MKIQYILKQGFLMLSLCFAASLEAVTEGGKPNLIILHTDEQSFRSLSCYQKILGDELANPWHASEMVQTPNIDRIATEGALCTNYYASCPTCTPSRASMLSGLYPTATGADKNEKRMHNHIKTYAHILSDYGYNTSYIGKWHLDGVGEGLNFKQFNGVTDQNCGYSANRGFGFQDYNWRFETGHYPWVRADKSKNLKGRTGKKGMGWSWGPAKPAGESIYMTDFFMDKALEKMDEVKDVPFCIMLSIPDPHTPNVAREPYLSQYADVTFEEPATMSAITQTPRPEWGAYANKNDIGPQNTNDKYKAFNIEPSGHGTGYMNQYWGMVKCIDDNVGRMLHHLDSLGIANNTIILFTSDHGDMLFEHSRINKGVPYEGSAKVAFVIRYPDRIKAGKVIQTPQSNVDFAPTMLELMGAPAFPDSTIHGESRVHDFVSDVDTVKDENVVFFTQDGGYWIAAANDRYKLILNNIEDPWLCDAVTDPFEMSNNMAGNEAVALALEAKIKEELIASVDVGIHRPIKYITQAPEVPEIELGPDTVTSKPLNEKFFCMEGPAVFGGTTKKWTYGSEWGLTLSKAYEGRQSMVFTHAIPIAGNSSVHAPKGSVILGHGGHKATMMVYKKTGSTIKNINIVIKNPGASSIPAFDVSDIAFDEWVEVSQTFTMPRGSSIDGAVSFMVSPADAGPSNSVYLDNFTIIDAEDPNYCDTCEVAGECTPDADAILNSCLYDFETSIITPGSTWPEDEWYAANKVLFYFSLTTDKKLSGAQFLRFEHAGTLVDNAALYPKFGTLNIKAGAYTIALKVLKKTGSVIKSFHLIDEDGNDMIVDVEHIANDEWVTLNIPYSKVSDSDDKDRLRLLFKQDEVPDGNSTLYIDDIVLQEGSSALPSSASTSKIDVYPNPASVSLTVSAPDVRLLSIYDMNGTMLREFDKYAEPFCIQLDGLSPGMYVLKYESDCGCGVKKIQIK